MNEIRKSEKSTSYDKLEKERSIQKLNESTETNKTQTRDSSTSHHNLALESKVQTKESTTSHNSLALEPCERKNNSKKIDNAPFIQINTRQSSRESLIEPKTIKKSGTIMMDRNKSIDIPPFPEFDGASIDVYIPSANIDTQAFHLAFPQYSAIQNPKTCIAIEFNDYDIEMTNMKFSFNPTYSSKHRFVIHASELFMSRPHKLKISMFLIEGMEYKEIGKRY